MKTQNSSNLAIIPATDSAPVPFEVAGWNDNLRVVVRENGSNRIAGSSWDASRRVVTNRPEAVRVGPTGPEVAAQPDRDSGSYFRIREAEVLIASHLLGSDGFVAVIEWSCQDHCGKHYRETVTSIAGRVVLEEEIFFGTAYARWAEGLEGEAFAFLYVLAESFSRRTRRSLCFAAGMACASAPHAQRRSAWSAALRGMGFRGNTDAITSSVRTATVKAALRFGWKPSVSAPRFWEGLPAGVVEIMSPQDAEAKRARVAEDQAKLARGQRLDRW